MPRFLRSDLTYSLGGGFILGALALFFMQPADEQQSFNQYQTQSQASLLSSVKQVLS